MLDPGVLNLERAEALRLRLSIGGITIGLTAGDGVEMVSVSGDSAAFVVEDGPAEVELRVTRRLIPPATEPPIFDSEGTWRLVRRGGRDVFHAVAATAAGPNPYAELSLDPGDRTGSIVLDSSVFSGDGPLEALPYPLAEVLAVRLLGAGRGVEFHACGVVDADGSGLLFTGHSGDGKTTTARLWLERPGVSILSDDRIIVRQEAGRFWMYGTPWHGEARLASTLRVPLKAVYFLERGEENLLIPVSPAKAVAMLFARAFPAFHDADNLTFVLESLTQLAKHIPCQRFPFRPSSASCSLIASGPRR